MANREEILKQSARFRHTLYAMEHVIKNGNADALEDLIKSASEARASWQLGGPRGGGGNSGGSGGNR
jgi:prephenate dehydrogenase